MFPQNMKSLKRKLTTATVLRDNSKNSESYEYEPTSKRDSSADEKSNDESTQSESDVTDTTVIVVVPCAFDAISQSPIQVGFHLNPPKYTLLDVFSNRELSQLGLQIFAQVDLLAGNVSPAKLSALLLTFPELNNKVLTVEYLAQSIGWSDAEAAHDMSFEIGRGYTENAVGVEEGNVFDLGIASPGGVEKSWTDREAAKNVGHDTVSPESIVLGATFEEGVEAVLCGNTDVESVFLAKFVKRFKSTKRTATTTAPGE
ncbi:hypothetical protein L7F22_026603, partial [Adiantum nelumboides]|nr:hypothetical protein [Adiantum nelumboides]